MMRTVLLQLRLDLDFICISLLIRGWYCSRHQRNKNLSRPAAIAPARIPSARLTNMISMCHFHSDFRIAVARLFPYTGYVN